MPLTLSDLRRHAVARSLFGPTTLQEAIDAFGFVQADPIRAPARAQDLILRQRVAGYRAGDLEREFAALDVDEDVFINYGFVSRRVSELMHPRRLVTAWSKSRRRRADELLAFVRERGEVHPRAADAHFAHGSVINYWGGSSSATTHLLDAMQYAGLVRVTRREQGIRLYAERVAAVQPPDAAACLDALVDVVVAIYAPVSAPGLVSLISRLRYAAPQWARDRKAAGARARARLAHAPVEGQEWYWPAGEEPSAATVVDEVRLLAPFDPIVWDRRRFAQLWGWEYRFEAYTPVSKRKLGYYALPLLWRDRVIGWGTVTSTAGRVDVQLGYVTGRAPRDRAFRPALDAELARLRAFLGAESSQD
jgi:uncharacterized protein YcaQ